MLVSIKILNIKKIYKFNDYSLYTLLDRISYWWNVVQEISLNIIRIEDITLCNKLAKMFLLNIFVELLLEEIESWKKNSEKTNVFL